ncbi:hypothetical protein ACFQ9X_44015 [Catenulispora yoronensis]
MGQVAHDIEADVLRGILRAEPLGALTKTDAQPGSTLFGDANSCHTEAELLRVEPSGAVASASGAPASGAPASGVPGGVGSVAKDGDSATEAMQVGPCGVGAVAKIATARLRRCKSS